MSKSTHATVAITAVCALLIGTVGFTACASNSATLPTDRQGTASAPTATSTATSPPDEPESAAIFAPGRQLTVISEVDASAASISVSATLFASSPAVIVVPAGDMHAQLLGASAAVALGVPLLVGSGSTSELSAGADVSLSAEVERLGASSVITVGDVLGRQSLAGPESRLVPLEATVDAVDGALDDALGAAHTQVLTGTGLGSQEESAAVGMVAALSRNQGTEGPPGTLALATDAVEEVAAVATARAAGVPVTVLPPDQVDPLSSAAIMTALSAAQPQHVLALGSAFADDNALEWKLANALSGRQLPGGGGNWFPGHTLIGIYGTPGTATLGLLGEQNVKKSITRARKFAAPYTELTSTTVVPAFEIIATVAAGSPGRDGDYSNEMDIATLQTWAMAADKAGVAVVIDLQPGRSDFLSQAKQYEPLLKLPNVGLALDPEWRLKAKEVPLEQIGSVNAKEVNKVVTWLADLTRDNGLPQKLFVLHQFQNRMIRDRASIDTSRAELAMLIHADGQGGQPDKQATWAALHVDAPAGVSWGWKNFIDEDHPMLTPKQTMQVHPVPNLVTYQ